MSLAINQVVHNNRYRIDDVLGQGESGVELYGAWDMRQNTRVAIIGNPDVPAANIPSGLSHPNLPDATDDFFLPGQGQYFVTALVEGEDPQVILKRFVPSEPKIQQSTLSRDVTPNVLVPTPTKAGEQSRPRPAVSEPHILTNEVNWEQIKQELEQTHGQLDAPVKQTNAHESSVTTLQQDVGAVTQRAEAIEQNVKTVGDELSRLGNVVRQQAQQIEEIHQTFCTYDKHLANVNQKLDQAHGQLDALLQRTDAYEAAVSTLNQDVKAVTQRMEAVKQDVRTVGDQVSRLGNIVRQQVQQVGEIHHAVSAIKTNISKFSDAANKEDEIPQFRYILRAADQMHDLMVKTEAHPEQSRAYLVESATIACEALTGLAIDHDFRRAVFDLADTQKQNSREYREYMQDLTHFRQFLELERKVLIRSGLSNSLTDQIIEQIGQLSQELIVAARSKKITPDRVFVAIENLKGQTCELPYQLRQEASRAERTEQLKKIGLAIAGGVVIVVRRSG